MSRFKWRSLLAMTCSSKSHRQFSTHRSAIPFCQGLRNEVRIGQVPIERIAIRTSGTCLASHQKSGICGDRKEVHCRIRCLSVVAHQYSANPDLCQRKPVSGIMRVCFHPGQNLRTNTQKNLPKSGSLGLGYLRFNAANC